MSTPPQGNGDFKGAVQDLLLPPGGAVEQANIEGGSAHLHGSAPPYGCRASNTHDVDDGRVRG